LVERDLIVAPHLQFHLQLAEILHEVVGERIVIVYDQNHFRTHNLIQKPENGRLNSAGNLYLANYGAGNIEKFDTNGTPATFAFPYGEPYGLTVDSADNVYVG
jgi:hypothetical protein